MCDTPPINLEANLETNKELIEEKNVDHMDEENSFEVSVTNIEIEKDEESSNLKQNTEESYNLKQNNIVGINTSVINSSGRSTRSKDNPEILVKQKNFIAKIQAATSGNGDTYRPETPGKRKRESNLQNHSLAKRKKNYKSDFTQEWQNDRCCWQCHREGQFICCEMCPRVYHLKCAGLEKEPEEDWACSECHAVMQAENVENRSLSMQLISVDQLCILLKYALNRLQSMPAMQPFAKPVDINEFPTYWEMVIHPVDFTTLERNIKKKFYGSTEAFMSDSRWILHNSVIFNGANSKVSSLARTFIKILKQELSEIDTCPDCYENAHTKPDSWFTEACRMAHPLVWARLKGFPFWPAKAVKWKDTMVDVRFFGRHDRSWVQIKECYLYSEQMPTPLKSKNKTLEACLLEVEEHLTKLRERFGTFQYANHRVAFNPYDADQIRLLLPTYKGPTIMRMRSQTRSLSRLSFQSATDDETSSVASTDSGTSSIKLQKKLLKERLLLNTPDTELETYSNEEDIKSVETDKMSENEDDSKEKTKFTDILNDNNACTNKDIETGDVATETECTKERDYSFCVDENEESIDEHNVPDVISKLSSQIDDSTKSESNEYHGDDSNGSLNDSTRIDLLRTLKPGPLSKKKLKIRKLNNCAKNESDFLESNNLINKNPNKEEENAPTDNILNSTGSNTIIDDLERINALLRNDLSDNSKANTVTDHTKVSKQLTCNNNSQVTFESNKENSFDGSQIEIHKDNSFIGDLNKNNVDKDSDKGDSNEDSFKGFHLESSHNKRIDVFKEILKSSQIMSILDQDVSKFDESNTTCDKSNTSYQKPKNIDDEARDFNEQLFNNSSLTIGKVNLPKSVNVQKVSSESKSIPLADMKSHSSDDLKDKKNDSKLNSDEEVDVKGKDKKNDSKLEIDMKSKDQSFESTILNFKDYASKIFHNITISSKSLDSLESKDCEKEVKENKGQLSKEESQESKDNIKDKSSTSDSLLEAVKLVQNIGNIKRNDRVLEHTSGNDKVTISVADDEMETLSSKSKRRDSKSEDPLVSISSSVSVTKASDKEKAKVPSGVDTTRLSPSISIIPVASSASEKIKSKSTPSPSPSTTPHNSFMTFTSASGGSANTGSTTPSSQTVSPNIAAPSLLPHSLTSPTNTVRNMFSPHMPGLTMQGGARTPITSPGLRMLGNAPGILLGGRIQGPQLIRHLPPDAGPLSCELHKHSQKLAEMMRNSLEEVLGGLVGIGTPEARLAALQLELERCNWRHQQEMVEVRHNADVMLVEIRANLEAERVRAVEEVRRQMEQKVTELRRQMELQMSEKISEVKRQLEIEKQRAIEDTKKKQWCANCGKEALFFCCWNTSYCDYPCQQTHWPQHMPVCGQNTDSGSGGVNNSEGGGSESINGDVSSNSSGIATPLQNIHGTQVKNLIEEEDHTVEERRRKKRKEIPSPVYSDSGMGRSISPAGSGNNLVGATIPIGGTSPLSQSLGLAAGMRPGMGPPSVAAIAAMSGNPNAGMAMKMSPRFIQHSMLQQQPMFTGMDPRMLMMMGRNMGPTVMMRGHMQQFRPRFM